ncbi:MAG: Flagellar protein FlgN [Candidatus Hydrogenedentes bacterium]|nr:Flagellar protein FlgN [Candidatus Hydrogenedentota bacterium]
MTAQSEQLLERLCNHLADEFEHQQIALALCRAQGEALRAHDTEYLEAKTEALNALVNDRAEAESLRNTLVRAVASSLGLPASQSTLTALAEAVSEPWKSRLQEAQMQIRKVVSETRAVVRSNAGIVRASIRVVEETMHAFEEAVFSARGEYTPRGANRPGQQRMPALIDQKG